MPFSHKTRLLRLLPHKRPRYGALRTEVKENDIPDIIARFHNLNAEIDRKRTEQSFFVPKEEIAANGYDLSINKYKETEYVPVEYPSTTEILADLHELEMEITKGLAELEEMV